jgi:CHAD domain-containing protein
MLKPGDRALLKGFVGRSPPGTAYLRRARIVLLADDGLTSRAIAAEVGLPLNRVRQVRRAYKRQGLAYFPADLVRPPLFTAAEPLVEAARKVMAEQLAVVQSYQADLAGETSITAVHETRKAIRQLRTALSAYASYFEADVLDAYRRRFRKLMRRLAGSRDAAVFLQKLDAFIVAGEAAGAFDERQQASLAALRDRWLVRQSAANDRVRDYVSQPKVADLLASFGRFTATPGQAAAVLPLGSPFKVAHLAPLFVHQRLAHVRAYEDRLEGSPLEEWHALRIACKELRYTLDFFAPVLGPTATEATATLKELLGLLGELNDVRVALEWLAEERDVDAEPAVALLRAARSAEADALLAGPLFAAWSAVSDPAWRAQVAAAVAVL